MPAIRLHFLLIVLVVTAFGFAVNKVLLACGVDSLIWRNILVVTISYGTMFFAIGVWTAMHEKSPHLEEMAKQSSAFTAMQAAKEERAAKEKKPASEEPGKPSAWDALNAISIADGGCGTTVLVVAILGALAAWVYAEGPLLLANLAFDMAVSLGLIKISRKTFTQWHERTFSSTITPFLILLAISTLIMAWVESACPGAHQLSEALRACHK